MREPDRMSTRFWTWPIAIYLFLGGLGGGTVFLAGVFYFMLRNTCEVSFLGFGIFMGIVMMALGCLLLIFELGQPILFPRAFLAKTAIIKWGAVLLSVAMIAALVWWVYYWPSEWNLFWYTWTGLRDICAFVAMCASMGLMMYTGVLLSSMKSRPFWNTPAVPILFTVSAMSTGTALLALCIVPGCPIDFWMFEPWTPQFITEAVVAYEVYELLHAIDIVLIAMEIAILLFIVIMQYSSSNVTAKRVAKRWLVGETKYLFWIGMIFLGLICPLCGYIFGPGLGEFGELITGYGCPALALCGGLLLRFLFVYNNDRRAVPGERKYYERLPKKDDPIYSPYWETEGGIF